MTANAPVGEESSSKMMNRRVSFDRISIREYARCLGDNPAVTHGPPISIDWNYDEVGTFEVEEFEQTRSERSKGHELMLPGVIREQILLDHTDATKNQIYSKVAEVNAARQERQLCYKNQEWEEWQEIFESFKRKFRRIKKGLSKKREQQLLWENAKRHMEEKQRQEKLESESSTSTEASSEQLSEQYVTEELNVNVHSA